MQKGISETLHHITNEWRPPTFPTVPLEPEAEAEDVQDRVRILLEGLSQCALRIQVLPMFLEDNCLPTLHGAEQSTDAPARQELGLVPQRHGASQDLASTHGRMLQPLATSMCQQRLPATICTCPQEEVQSDAAAYVRDVVRWCGVAAEVRPGTRALGQLGLAPTHLEIKKRGPPGGAGVPGGLL